jgi:hypothetical protein
VILQEEETKPAIRTRAAFGFQITKKTKLREGV